MNARGIVNFAIAVVSMVLVAVFAAWLYLPDKPIAKVAAVPVAEPSTRKAFLAGRDLPDGTWLLLTRRAFGGGEEGPAFRVIRDTAALRAAAPDVWVDDDQAARDRMVLLSVLFLSPGVPNESFATLLYPDGRQEHLTAYHDTSTDAAMPRSDLGNLLAISRPVFARNALLQDAAAYDALVAQVGQDPDLFFLEPPHQPGSFPVYPVEAGISLPSLLLKAANLTDARVAQEIARVQPAFAATFGAPGPQYDVDYVSRDYCEAAEVWPVGGDAPVMIGGQPLTLSGFGVLTVTANLSATPDVMARLPEVAPAFVPAMQADPAVSGALMAALAMHLPGASPADYTVQNDCWTPDLTVTWASPHGASPEYFEIVAEAP